MRLGLMILLLIVLVVWFNHARYARKKARQSGAAGGTSSTNADKSTRPEMIVGCSHCGLHVPASDAVFDAEGTNFCCEAHRRLHNNA